MKQKKVRYAVVGMGHIAQVAVLPAFEHARKNSECVAVVSGDQEKHRFLNQKYNVETFTYEQYDQLLDSGTIDAVYIALPNNMHCEYSVRAAEAGIHVLCEKPMAVTEDECKRMIHASQQNRVRLMIAYRLHFEEANMQAIKILQSGKIGKLRLFNSVFSMQVRRDNIRTQEELGGGTLYDIGIYCINAARYLFRAEPYEVFAYQESGPDKRFREVEEMTSAILKFPDDRLAMFSSSFGASDVSSYQVVGSKGDLRVDPAYEYVGDLMHHLTLNGKSKTKVFKQKDQFAPELIYFSECIQKNKNPEPSGWEGLADVRIIEALEQSASTGKPVKVKAPEPVWHKPRPQEELVIKKAAIAKPESIHVRPASGGP